MRQRMKVTPRAASEIASMVVGLGMTRTGANTLLRFTIVPIAGWGERNGKKQK